MHNPYDNNRRMELISLALAAISGIAAIIQGHLLLFVLALFLIAVSILSESLLYFHTNKTPEAIKQGVKASLLIILIAVLFFYI